MRETNNILIKHLLLLLLMTFWGQGQLMSQSEEPPIEQRRMPLTIRFDGGLGNVTKPLAMKNNFYSVGDIDLGFHLGIAKGWNVGLNMRYTGFQIRQGASNFADTIINGLVYQVRTIQNAWTPGLSVSYDKWVGKYTSFNFNLTTGYSFVNYTKIRSAFKGDPALGNYETLTIEPAINLIYFFEEHVGVTFKVSYTRTFADFQPSLVGLDGGVIQYVTPDLKGNIQFISFGLGFVYSFKRID
jgi:hypothetical protein